MFTGVYQESRRAGFTHWLAAMEPSLQRMMRAYFRVPFEPVGPAVEFQGTVMPYLADLGALDQAIAREQPRYAEGLVTNLEREYRPDWAL